MDLTTHLRTFALVARSGGFSDAARQLDVVPSVVARRIAQLEQELGVRLFERTTRRMALTQAGERLSSRAVAVVNELEELLESVHRDEGRLEGHLRVMAPTTLTLERLGDVFCDFMREHPRITLDIALVDRSANPAEGGFDLAISGRAASYEGVLDIPLCPVWPSLCAAPSYLAERAAPTHPRDLVDHACLVFSATGTSWAFQSSRGMLTVDVRPRLLADDNRTLRRAAEAGLGIALLPDYVAREPLDAGRLTRLLPAFTPQENGFKAFVPKRKVRVARVKALVEFLQQRWADPIAAAPPPDGAHRR